MKITFKKFLAVAVVSSVLIYSCKKNATNDVLNDSDIATATDNTIAQKGTQDAGVTAQEAISGSIGSERLAGGDTTATITFDTLGTLKSMDINFLAKVNLKGILREGKMHVVFNKHYSIPGALWTINFSNYKYNKNKFEGSVILENENGVYHLHSSSLACTLTNGKTITYAPFNLYVQYKDVKGPTTKASGNNIMELWGDISGSESDGNKTTTYTDTIPEPQKLVFNPTCPDTIPGKARPHFVAGTIKYKVGVKRSTINFGNGDCSSIATITSGGITSNFKY